MARSGGTRRHRRVREAAAAPYETPSLEGVAGVLYDSDVIIELLRGRPAVIQAARALETAGIPTYCSAVSLAEIYARIRPGEEAPTQAFFDARGEIILDAHVGRVAGSYLARYARSHSVELADALIAAAATTSGVRLWTRNRKHYPMPDLQFYET
jgi:predicted nucleic acid-binding protein